MMLLASLSKQLAPSTGSQGPGHLSLIFLSISLYSSSTGRLVSFTQCAKEAVTHCMVSGIFLKDKMHVRIVSSVYT